MWTDFYNNCKYHHTQSCSNFSEYWVTLRTVLGLSHVSIFSGGGVMWGCSHGSVQWYERAGCDIVHIAEWEWPWRMITGQCGECLVRCHDASDSSDTGWLCNTSEAGHNPGPGQWRLNRSQMSVSEQANFPNIFLPPTTNSSMIGAPISRVMLPPFVMIRHCTGWSGAAVWRAAWC